MEVHRLLHQVQEGIPMKNETSKSTLLPIIQTAPSIILLICALFGIFVGMRFITFLDHTEIHRTSISDKWSETGFEQLEQMNATIKQELDLILDQRRENQVLQEKIRQLTTTATPLKSTPEKATLPLSPMEQSHG